MPRADAAHQSPFAKRKGDAGERSKTAGGCPGQTRGTLAQNPKHLNRFHLQIRNPNEMPNIVRKNRQTMKLRRATD